MFKDQLSLQRIHGKIYFELKLTTFVCFSPYAGDMLKLTAVDLPELHCLSDVIVFSTEGNRRFIYFLLYIFDIINIYFFRT